MDTQEEYELGKSIVCKISENDWELLRTGKGPWSEESWKMFMNYSISELKQLMSAYKSERNYRQEG